MTTRARVVVVGAGIAGLAAAHRLHSVHPDVDVVVLDAAERPGGKILTTPFAGHPAIDAGADAFLARMPAAVALCEALGLGDRFVHPATGSAFVWSNGALHRLPDGLVLGVPTDLDALGASGIVSDEAVRRAARDLDAGFDGGPLAPGDDETVGSLVRRRLGDEVFEVLVSPLLSGVNAGDADRLSVRAGAPQLAAAAADPRGLIEGARATRAAAVAAGTAAAPVFTGLRGGSGTLIDALVASLPDAALRLGVRVESVTHDGGRATLHTTDAQGASSAIAADAVVLATPAGVVSAILDGALAPDVAASMRALAWASVVMVTLAVPLAAIEHPLDGSGFLVADHDELEILTACSFGSTKWAHWNDGEQAILRVSAGRWGDERALSMSDDALVEAIERDLHHTIGLRGASHARRVTRWTDGLPQYVPGHLDRVASWREAVHEALDVPIELAGASYEGLGVPACIAGGQAAADGVARRLG